MLHVQRIVTWLCDCKMPAQWIISGSIWHDSRHASASIPIPSTPWNGAEEDSGKIIKIIWDSKSLDQSWASLVNSKTICRVTDFYRSTNGTHIFLHLLSQMCDLSSLSCHLPNDTRHRIFNFNVKKIAKILWPSDDYVYFANGQPGQQLTNTQPTTKHHFEHFQPFGFLRSRT